MVSFLAKYFDTQFMIPTWKANILLGVLNILSASGGTFIGGAVVSRFKLSPRRCLQLMVLVSVVSSIFNVAGFFLGCDQPLISKGASTGLSANGLAADASCSGECHCDEGRFFPTCGADGITYFSPCHAGCSETDGMSYLSCSCINTTLEVTSWSRKSRDDADAAVMAAAVPGFCDQDCSNLYPYAFSNFFGGMFACLVIMPAFVVTVRSVSESDKPLAIGLSAFLATLLGWFLGPIVYGRIIDTCCLLWSSGCDGKGSCSLYDSELFRYRYHALFVSTRILCCLLYALALLIAVLKKDPFTAQRETTVAGGLAEAHAPEGEQFMLEKTWIGNVDDDDEEEQFVASKPIFIPGRKK